MIKNIIQSDTEWKVDVAERDNHASLVTWSSTLQGLRQQATFSTLNRAGMMVRDSANDPENLGAILASTIRIAKADPITW